MTAHVRLFEQLGQLVRRLREERGLSQKVLAERAGLSLRFLSEVEAGHSNISIGRLADLAQAFKLPLVALVPQSEDLVHRAPVVALLGLRGAGKSSVGALLAPRIEHELVELDEEIEQRAGLRLSEIFELHGETYYRRIEREALSALLASGRALVIATGGGLVSDAATWALLRSRARTVWLRAQPEDHFTRVLAQGDARPMADRPQAMSELRSLLSARAPLYAQAELTVETSGRAPSFIAAEIEAWLPH